MKFKFLCSLTAAIVLTSAAALAQATGSSALPAAPGTANDPPAVTSATGSKVGAINVEQAIFASNEGQRDMDALGKKFEPKSTELKTQNDEIEAMKKKLNTQNASLNDQAKGDLQRQIDQKQKALERQAQDAREDFQTQQNEIGQRIFQKMGPLILKYANDNGLGVIIDTSNPWPNGPVLWAGPSVDITKAIVDAYNVQSGVAAPARPAGATGTKPLGGTGTKPTTTTPKAPATTPPTK